MSEEEKQIGVEGRLREKMVRTIETRYGMRFEEIESVFLNHGLIAMKAKINAGKHNLVFKSSGVIIDMPQTYNERLSNVLDEA